MVPETPAVAHVPRRDDPLELLRDVIAQLKSPAGPLPDQEQLAHLLAEAREALERANIVAPAAAQCDAHAADGRFDQALDALDEGLRAYPGDPRLVARRTAVEERRKALYSANAARGAIQQAAWLLDHNRADLAVQFLRQKAAELPDREELTARLAELEALLPQWEEEREVRDALARAFTLEALEQWQAALTVIEEALESHASNLELRKTAERISRHLAEFERRKRLARRIEAIRQQIAAGSWRQALSLLENTELEFPDEGLRAYPGDPTLVARHTAAEERRKALHSGNAARGAIQQAAWLLDHNRADLSAGVNELAPLRHEIALGLRNSEREEAIAQFRKCLADGELEEAERALEFGVSALGAEREIEALRKELEAEKEYRSQLRQAQVLFGRRRLEEAERILSPLLDRDHREAQALSAAVRTVRAATAKENSLKQGREEALLLMGQQEFAQASDLLRNLLSSSAGDAIRERDLAAAQDGLKQQAAAIRGTDVPPAKADPPVEEPAAVEPPPAALPEPERASAIAPGRRRAAIAATASLLLASAAGIAWKLTHPAATARTAAVTRAAASSGAAALGVSQPSAPQPDATTSSSASAGSPRASAGRSVAAAGQLGRQHRTPSNASDAIPVRSFIPPSAAPSRAQNPRPSDAQSQNAALPPPPGTDLAVSVTNVPAFPAVLSTASDAAAPPPPPVVAADPLPAPRPEPPIGGKFEQAQLITRVPPTYPAAARQRAILGDVRLIADIDERGNVKNVKILTGNAALSAAAKTAVLQWKYRPATLNGRPISTTAEITVVFKER